MKIVLVNPFFTYTHKFIPQNLIELASYVLEKFKNVHIEIVDLQLELDFNKSPDELMLDSIELVKNADPDLIGIPCHTIHVPFVYKFTNMFKKYYPNIPIVLGGSHVNYRYREVFKICNIDYIVRGEGEETFLELVKYLFNGSENIKSIDGLVYKKNGEIIVDQERKFIKEIPFADFTIINKYQDKIKQFPKNKINLVFSRGCVGSCIFCSTNRIWKGQRRKSLEKIEKELICLVKNFDMKYVEVSDNCFTLHNDWAMEIMKLFKSLNLDWGCLTRLDQVDFRIIDIMAENNCKEIYFGVESGSYEYRTQYLSKGYQTHVTNEYIVEIAKRALNVQIQPVFSFIYNMPNEGWFELKATFELAKRVSTMGAKVQLWILTPYHDSKVYHQYKDVILQKPRYELFKDASVFLHEQFELFYDVIDLPEIVAENPDYFVLDPKIGLENLQEYYLSSRVELEISNYEINYDYLDYHRQQFIELHTSTPIKDVLQKEIYLSSGMQLDKLLDECKKSRISLFELHGDVSKKETVNNFKFFLRELNKAGIRFKIINPFDIEDYNIPRSCKYCIKMFYVDSNGYITFCNGKKLFYNDKGIGRNEIYQIFNKMKISSEHCLYKYDKGKYDVKLSNEDLEIYKGEGYSIPVWIEWVNSYGEIIIRNRLDEKILYLNKSGAVIWKKILDGTIDSLLDNKNVVKFLETLQNKKLIIKSNGGDNNE